MVINRKRRNSRFTFIVLLLISVTVITVYYRGHARTLVSDAKGIANDIVDPIGHVVAAAAHPVEHFLQGATDYGSLLKANARLRAENRQLQAELGTATRAENELNQLKQQDGLPYLQGMSTVSADVIDTTPSNFEASVAIDKGSSSGVASGMPVVSGGGLVGTVVETSSSYSIVQLISSPTSRIAERYDTSAGQPALIGVADGEGEGNFLKVEYVDPHLHLAMHELMFTSGLAGGTLPPDIPVGEVASISAGAGGLQQDVSLSPVADLSQLQFVRVVEWEPST